MTKVMRRPYRDGYFWLLFGSNAEHKEAQGTNRGIALYVESLHKHFGSIRQWCVDNGFAQPQDPVATADGYLATGTKFGLESGDRINIGRINKAALEIRNKSRVSWPEDAREICDRYERKIYELFELLDSTSDAKDAYDVEIRSLEVKLNDAERITSRANDTAEEMKRRAKEVDIDRLRRDLATEFSLKTEALHEENRRLAAGLYEATSQVTKLSEDKKRLRAALNTARNR